MSQRSHRDPRLLSQVISDENEHTREMRILHVLGDRSLAPATRDEVARQIRARLVAWPELPAQLLPPVDKPEAERRRELAQRVNVLSRPRQLPRRRDSDHPMEVSESAPLLLPNTRDEPTSEAGSTIRSDLRKAVQIAPRLPRPAVELAFVLSTHTTADPTRARHTYLVPAELWIERVNVRARSGHCEHHGQLHEP